MTSVEGGDPIELLREAREEIAMLRALLQASPAPIAINDNRGAVILLNDAARKILGAGDEVSMQEHLEAREFFRDEHGTRIPMDEMPGILALQGKRVDSTEFLARAPSEKQGVWVRGGCAPIFGDDGAVRAVISVFWNATRDKQVELDLAARNEALHQSEAERERLVERLQMTVKELSTPILEVGEGVLALPVIGVVDSRRGADIMDRLLDAVVERGARYVILDLTGVNFIDTETASHFIKLAQALSLVGAHSVLTGIQPSVAQALVGLGVDLNKLTVLRSLRAGLLYAQRQASAPADRRDATAAPATR